MVEQPTESIDAYRLSVSRQDLRSLVDLVHGYCYENESVPSTETADGLIDKWLVNLKLPNGLKFISARDYAYGVDLISPSFRKEDE